MMGRIWQEFCKYIQNHSHCHRWRHGDVVVSSVASLQEDPEESKRDVLCGVACSACLCMSFLLVLRVSQQSKTCIPGLISSWCPPQKALDLDLIPRHQA